MKERNLAAETVRSAALRILLEVEKGKYAQGLVNSFPGAEKDKRLLGQLVYGTIRHQGTLDTFIKQKTSKVNQLILRIAAFQMLYLDRIPDYAIVNESVNLAKKFSTQKSAGFINAILNNWLRSRPQLDLPNPQKDFTNYLAVKYSFPVWLIKRWLNNFSKQDVEKLCMFYNEIPPLLIRVNTLKTTALELQGILQTKTTVHSLSLQLETSGAIEKLAGFKEGLFQVQDIANLFVVDSVEVKPGMRVLDLCAAPGGKACYLAQLMQNQGEIVAVDLSAEKINKIKENAERLGINNICIVKTDGRKIAEGKFDRVLVDTPCSNTGVLRRRVEVRWRLRKDDFFRLNKLQLELLSAGARSLKDDGVLVYSTCSVDSEENEGVINNFLLKNPHFKLKNSFQKLPFRDQMDGVYAAQLVFA